MTWFYLHCVAALVIIIADYNGTLEPAVNAFEKKLDIYTEPVEEEVLEEEKDKEIEDERKGR
jgi:hypothetical protein